MLRQSDDVVGGRGQGRAEADEDERGRAGGEGEGGGQQRGDLKTEHFILGRSDIYPKD